MIKWIIISAVCGILFAIFDTIKNRRRYKKFEKTTNSLTKSLRVATKNLRFKNKKKIMDEYGEKLMEWYMKGFRDELNGSTSVDPQDRLLLKSYMTGAGDALIGDDISSVDETPPNFTSIWVEATKMKEGGEISETQLLKIFRVLSRMRNNGNIILHN